jgi:fluoroacetyl-CoA thioesterase
MYGDKLVGAIGMAAMTIRPGDTSVATGVSDLPVVSSSALLSLVEIATTAALQEYFEPGETTSSGEIVLTVLSAVNVGNELRANSTCVESRGGVLTFNAEVNHESRLVATARIQRKIVDRVSFMARAAAEGLLTEKSS